MTGALTGIALAFLISATTLVVVLFRVSPLTSPKLALPFFFLSLFICLSSLVALLASIIKALISHQPFLTSTYVSSSLRQGIFFGIASTIVVFLHLMEILNWWIGMLVYLVFLFIEIGVNR